MLNRPCFGVVVLCVASLWGQTANSTQQSEPAMVQIKKLVAFIKLTCTEGNQTNKVKGTVFLVVSYFGKLGHYRFFGLTLTHGSGKRKVLSASSRIVLGFLN
jgi:hypothetical protein